MAYNPFANEYSSTMTPVGERKRRSIKDVKTRPDGTPIEKNSIVIGLEKQKEAILAEIERLNRALEEIDAKIARLEEKPGKRQSRKRKTDDADGNTDENKA